MLHLPLRREPPGRDLTTREGWAAWAGEPEPTRPERPSPGRWRDLSEEERVRFVLERMRWNAAFKPIKTPALRAIHDQLHLQLAGNQFMGAGEPRPGALIDAPANVGKSWIQREFGRLVELQLRQSDAGGSVDSSDVFVPVVYIALHATTTIKGFNAQWLRFYGAPPPARGRLRVGDLEIRIDGSSKDNWTDAIGELGRACATQLVLIDDIHRLKMGNETHRNVNDHLKDLMSLIPATFVFAGINCGEASFLTEGYGNTYGTEQTGERFMRLRFEPYALRRTGDDAFDADDWADWGGLLKVIEKRLILMNHEPGEPYLRTLQEYLHERSGGRIGRLMNLLRKAAVEAMRTETEQITEEMLSLLSLPKDRDELEEEAVARGQRRRSPSPAAQNQHTRKKLNRRTGKAASVPAEARRSAKPLRVV